MLPSWQLISGGLIGGGAAALYFYKKYSRSKDTISYPLTREEPTLNDFHVSEKHEDDIVAETKLSKEPLSDLVVLYIMADKAQPFSGYELLQALLSVELRFGKGNIFHRYSDNEESGEILFSVASIKEPGTFEMSKIGGFTTPGLAVFLQLGRISDPMLALETLLGTVKQLAEELGGTVKDDKHQPLKEEKIAQWYDLAEELMKKQHTYDLFN